MLQGQPTQGRKSVVSDSAGDKNTGIIAGICTVVVAARKATGIFGAVSMNVDVKIIEFTEGAVTVTSLLFSHLVAPIKS